MTDTTEPVAGAPAPEPTAPVEPQSTAPQADPAPTEEPTEDSAPSTEDPGSDSADDQRPKKKGGGFQKRIDELTRTNYEERLRREAAEQELAALRQQSRTDLSAEPGPEPTLEQFETIEQFKQAHADWARREGYRAAMQEQQEQRHRSAAIEAQARLQQRVDAAKVKYTDFAPVVSQVAPIIDGNPAVLQYVMSSESGAELSYHLGKNPAVLLELTRLDPLSQVRELTKLEMRLSAAPPPKPLTNAPPPAKPVGARETVPVTLGDLARSDDAAAYIRKANQRRAN